MHTSVKNSNCTLSIENLDYETLLLEFEDHINLLEEIFLRLNAYQIHKAEITYTRSVHHNEHCQSVRRNTIPSCSRSRSKAIFIAP